MLSHNNMPALSLQGLKVSFAHSGGRVEVVSELSFTLSAGETLGLVGESGCGKSVSALAIMRLLPKPAGVIEAGAVHCHGEDILKLPLQALRKWRGRRLAMIFQEPMTALNPVHSIGAQIAEMLRQHFPELAKSEQTDRTIQLLEQVGIPTPRQRLREYPHQLSGGMRQRVMIAMALAAEPEILIADEPTTALDVTIQAEILALLRDLQDKRGMAMLFITHDLGVIAEMSQRVLVMYSGVAVEESPVQSFFRQPAHPYSRGLLQAIPRLDSPHKQALPTISGMVPVPGERPPGCRFQNRCPYTVTLCKEVEPPLTPSPSGGLVRCHRAAELSQ